MGEPHRGGGSAGAGTEPRARRWHTCPFTGRDIELRLGLCTRRRWMRRAGAWGPGWNGVRFGPFVVRYRLIVHPLD
jgi:hypothetical protein